MTNKINLEPGLMCLREDGVWGFCHDKGGKNEFYINFTDDTTPYVYREDGSNYDDLASYSSIIYTCKPEQMKFTEGSKWVDDEEQVLTVNGVQFSISEYASYTYNFDNPYITCLKPYIEPETKPADADKALSLLKELYAIKKQKDAVMKPDIWAEVGKFLGDV